MASSDERLHQAVKARELGRVRELLSAGADPNALDAKGQPPLAYVLTSGIGFVFEDLTRALIEALLGAGADPRVAEVGRALVRDADGMVTAASEANEAHRLARLLGVKP